MHRVGIIGSTGYTGQELVNILLKHPKAEIALLASRHYAHQKYGDAVRAFAGKCEAVCQEYDEKKSIDMIDIAFICAPHNSAMDIAGPLVEAGKKVIDLSADFRLRDAAMYEKFYGKPHSCPKLLGKAVYGLTEVYRNAVRKTNLVANPGCYATVILLALLPVAKRYPVNIVYADGKSGLTGAGRRLTLSYHFVEANENASPYAVNSHRHVPEIEQELALHTGRQIRVVFVPHLIPLNRGILATLFVPLGEDIQYEEMRRHYLSFYKNEKFIRILPEGALPELRNVAHSNFCDIAISCDVSSGSAVITAAIDNLVKGAAGQAVQNMNIMCGWNEQWGLLP